MARSPLLTLALLALAATSAFAQVDDGTLGWKSKPPPSPVPTCPPTPCPEPCPKPPKSLCKSTIVFTEKNTPEIPAAGCTITNCTFGYTDNLFVDGKLVGVSEGLCNVFSRSDACGAVEYCTFDLRTCQGQITVQGKWIDRQGVKTELSVTGGTGIWNGASGTVIMQTITQGDTWQYTVKLVKPATCEKYKWPLASELCHNE